MAVLTANKEVPVKAAHGAQRTRKLPLVGYTTLTTTHEVYKGSIVICDQSISDGYFRACPASGSINSTTSDIFGGISMERVSVTASDAGDGSKSVTVLINGAVGFPIGSLTVTEIGAPIYAVDDQLVGSSSSNTYWVGTLVNVDSTYAWVDITHAVGRPNSAI